MGFILWQFENLTFCGSVDNMNVQLHNNYATGSYKYEPIEIKCVKPDWLLKAIMLHIQTNS